MAEQETKSRFVELFTEEVEKGMAPHVQIYGEDCPVARFGRYVLAVAETIDQQLQGERASTIRAASVTGWSADTLQRRAREYFAGKLPASWAGLVVERDGEGGPYVFVLSTIPTKQSQVA